MDEQTLAESLDKDTVDGKYLTFWIAEQLFGVEIALVLQIVGVQDITAVPEFPDYAKGFINLRGIITPVIDVRMRFGMPERVYDEKTCIIVTSINDKQIGFIVDAVDAVTNIDSEKISPPPAVTSRAARNYLTGVAQLSERVALLLDIQKLLSEDVLAVPALTDVAPANA